MSSTISSFFLKNSAGFFVDKCSQALPAKAGKAVCGPAVHGPSGQAEKRPLRAEEDASRIFQKAGASARLFIENPDYSSLSIRP